MISTNRVRNVVMFLLAKDNYGYLSPLTYDAFSDLAQMGIFEELFYKTNLDTIRKNNHLTN